MAKKNEISIDGVEYIRKDSIKNYENADVDINGYEFVLVRTYSAGVYFGWLKEEKGDEVIMVNARNVWYWDGAASLLQMANDGVSKPENCKFTKAVAEIKLKGVNAIIKCTKTAQDNLTSVSIWSK